MTSVLVLCALITLAVFGVMLYSVATFRAASPLPRAGHRNIALELVWALIPIAIFVAAATPAVRALMLL